MQIQVSSGTLCAIMLKIRLQRIGRRNDPHFRMLVAEHTAGPKSNKFVEKVGTLNPKTKELQLNAERIKYWLSVGAKASDRVHNMLVKAGIIKADTINVLPQKAPVIKEVSATSEATQDKGEEDASDTGDKTDEVSDTEEVTEEKVEDSAEETKEEKAEEEV